MSPTELFDVTPYSEAMTRYLLRHPLSSSLPRKFKIAFEGCADEDHALLGMHDLGYRAAIKDGKRGFRVVVGGGTSIMVKSAEPVHEFLPARRDVQRRRSGHSRLPRVRRLQTQAGEPAEVPDQEARLGPVSSPSTTRSSAEFRAQGGASLPFDPENPPVEQAPAWRRACDLAADSRNRLPRDELAGDRSGHRPAGPPDAADDERRLLALAGAPTCSRQKQSGIFLRDRDDSARRLHEPADADPRRSGDGVWRRHDPHYCRAGSRVPLGPGRRRSGAVPSARCRRAWVCPTPERSPT